MILPDTHAWIWLVNRDPMLPATLRDRLGSEALAIAAISLWEVAMMGARDVVELLPDAQSWLRDAIASYGITVLPITPEVAVRAVALRREMHRDPADCFIVATAQSHGLSVATRDRALAAFPAVTTIW